MGSNKYLFIFSLFTAGGGKRPWRRAPPLAFSSIITSAWTGKRPLRSAPLLHQLTASPPSRASSALYTSWVGPPRWIHKWFRSKVIALSFWFSAGCCHGWIQRDLPISPVPRRVAAMERSKVIYLMQVCWRELRKLLWPSHEVHWIPCWLGSYLSSSSLMTFIPPSILGSSRLVGLLAVLLLRHLLVLLHLLSGWASLHPGEEIPERKLSGLWGCCDGTFHMFHQVLGWSSCLRSPTNRHAVVRIGGSFHRTHLVIYASTTLQLSLRRLRCVPVPMHSPSVVSRTPMTFVQRTGTAPLIDCARRFSVSDPTRPRR